MRLLFTPVSLTPVIILYILPTYLGVIALSSSSTTGVALTAVSNNSFLIATEIE